jgi:ribonuclease Z
MFSQTEDGQNTLTHIWDYREKLPNTPYTISGHSRAAERTSFYVPELGILFDAGISTYHSPKIVLITHCHSDHCCMLPMVITNWKSSEPFRVIVPFSQKTMFNKYLNSSFQLFTENSHVSVTGCNIEGWEPNMEYNFGKNILIKTYKCDHSVGCLAYGIIEQRNKLKDEYRTFSGKDIALLRKDGVSITNEIYLKQFVYIGDTSIKIFENYPELFEYQAIIVECTYLRNCDEEFAPMHKHIHWKQLVQYIVKYPEVHFMLIHFSMRYKNEEVIDFFNEKRSQLGISNFSPWLN